MRRMFPVIAVIVLVSLGSALMLGQGTDPYVGTWKLNVAKSKFTGATVPKSEMRTVEAQGNGYKVIFDGVAADGSRIAFSLTSNLDGKPVPVSGVGIPGQADMAAVKRIDSHTTTTAMTKAGKPLATVRTVVSKDGKVTTQTTKGTDANGQPLNTVAVFDKQ